MRRAGQGRRLRRALRGGAHGPRYETPSRLVLSLSLSLFAVAPSFFFLRDEGCSRPQLACGFIFRLRFAGGLDPVEVFDSLPKELQEAFESKEVSKLQAALEAMPVGETASRRQVSIVAFSFLQDSHPRSRIPSLSDMCSR